MTVIRWYFAWLVVCYGNVNSMVLGYIEFCKIARKPVIDRCYTFGCYAQVQCMEMLTV